MTVYTKKESVYFANYFDDIRNNEYAQYMENVIFSELTEMDLLERVPASPGAFGELVQRYHMQLSRFVNRISFFQSEDIEDILQNAYIKAYRNIHRYNKSMKFSTWLYHIVRNTTIDEIRKVSVRPKLYSLEDEDIPKLFISPENLEESMWRKEDISEVRKAIAALPEKYREVLVLRYIEDKTYEAIMDIVELPKGTVAARISRSKKILQKSISSTNFFHTTPL